MSTNTSNFNLVLGGFGEFVDSWWEPLNDNFTTIDTELGAVKTEITDARQGKASLLAFLQVGINNDGTIKPTEEILDARNSFVYGHRYQDVTPDDTLNLLKNRLNQVDREVWEAREGQATLLASLGFRQAGVTSVVLSGTKDINGYPTWMGYSGAVVNLTGNVTPIEMMIDGKYARIRTIKSVTLSNPAGIKYIYATYQPTGVVNINGTNGVTALDVGSEFTIFSDNTKDFTTLDVQVGDLLTLTTGQDKGEYLIKEIAPGGNVAQLKIVGIFPVGGISAITYSVSDRFAVVVGADTTETPVAGKLYLGEAYYDGAAVSTIPLDTVAVRPRNFKDLFISEWRSIDVTGPSTFEEIFHHTLKEDTLEVSVQVSQTSDGLSPVEQLSLAQIVSTLGFTPSNGSLAVGAGTLAADNGTLGLTAGDQTITGVVALSGAPALSGTVGGSLTGDVKNARSITAKWDKNRIWVKNPHSGVFYTDYSGTVKTSGFLRVIIRKGVK